MWNVFVNWCYFVALGFVMLWEYIRMPRLDELDDY